MTPDDRRPALLRSYEQAARVIEGVTPGQLGLPTACPQYDVATMVDHLVGAAYRAAALGRAETPTGSELPRVELTDAPHEMRQAGKEAEAAWADEGRLDSTVSMPWGEAYTGRALVDMYLAELATHAWDLAQATGQLDLLDAGLAGPALTGARAILKPEYRNMVEGGSPFGSEVEAPADATEWERLAAFMGRRPRPESD